ncbi:MAG: response regulator [Candidatus Eremiobacteraeota bacterium]|nr:response regulator [Candidatus Eremiobacteraeota bacterium]
MDRPRFLSLNIKLALAMIPLIIVFMGFSFFVVLKHERDILRAETEKRATSLASGLAILSAEALRTFNDDQLVDNVDQFSRLKGVEYAKVEAPNGVAAFNSLGGINENDLPAAKEDGIHYITVNGQELLEVTRPIQIKSKRLGSIRIGISLEGLEKALQQSARYLFGLTLMLLSGATIFAALLARWFTRPLLRLARVAREVARGNLSSRAPTSSSDELGVLGSALNHMSLRLEHMIAQEKTARQRLQERVHNLLEFAGRVQDGDLTGQAPPGEDDDMGRLIMAVNVMVRHLRLILEEERSMRDNLERSRAELEAANDKLKELDQMKSEFLNTVSHELRTPLTSIKAFAEILLDNVGEDVETQTEFLEIINKESDRLTRLINNLLDLSRIEAGRMKWDMEPVDVHEVVSTAVMSLRGAAEKKGLIFESMASENLPTTGDRDKLIQVVTNLLGNAIKFTSEGGRVRIEATRVGDEVEIGVQDSGCGIDPEHHNSIFEKFSQVDTSETRDIKGSGLGLPIARSIVEHHHGRVWVESELGKGSRFIVRLPVTEESKPPGFALPRNRLADWSQGKRVLVVDDEPNIRRFLRHVLEGEGFQVAEARNGAEAVRMAHDDKPELVLLDLVLPDVNGFEVLTELKQTADTKGIPVIILSIIADEERCYRLGASDYLPKPINREKLVDRVERILFQRSEGKDILAVDDDDSVLKALQTILTGAGYTVRIARNGESAVQQAMDSPPSLILLDLMMPGMTGHDVLLKLKQTPRTASVPVVILTAAEPDERIRALRAGAESLMTKPFSEKELARLVRETLAEVALEPGDSPADREREAELPDPEEKGE